MDGIRVRYVPLVYEIYPLDFSSRYACSATGVAQRNVRYSKRARSYSSSSDSSNAGNPLSLLYFVRSDELQVYSLGQRRRSKAI